MNKIKILSDNLANQIAAGEVVERPASVIKELIENSIDAGARRIQIEVELGGRRLMRVADDGEGMQRDDAILAFERHATSKIKNFEDLSAIQTLGFRGEALASIASVAKVELITKTAETEAATRVAIEGGKLIDVKDAARSNGTTISVRDLFFNTPARRKFMRSEATENYHLTNIVTHYALAHPEIAFTLINNGREVLRVSAAKDLRERAFQIFGANLLESLLPVNGGREYVAKISGFVSAPRERRTTRDAQYFFVNRRFVRDKIIAGGLQEGFRSVLPHGVYPVAFVFLDIPHQEIDVNVHPAKTEIRFRRSDAVKETIAEAIREALAQAGITGEKASDADSFSANILNEQRNRQPADQETPSFANIPLTGNLQQKIEFSSLPSTVSFDLSPSEENSVDEQKKEIREFLSSADISTGEQHETEIAAENEDESENRMFDSAEKKETFENFSAENNVAEYFADESEKKAFQARLPPVDSAGKAVKTVAVEGLANSQIRVIGQLHDSFIIATDEDGLLLIDQHAAHERILFDKFRCRETERKPASQNLLLPETIDLSPAQAEVFAQIESELEEIGFGVIRLSGRTVAIKSVPVDLPRSEARSLLAEILDTVETEKRGSARANWSDQIAASLACKAAVKINTKLTDEKMRWLIEQLLLTSSPTTCPNGRPVVLRLSVKDLERGFHRL